MRATAMATATGLVLTLASFLVAKRALDLASFALASVGAFLDSAKPTFACLACFLALWVTSFTSLRLAGAAFLLRFAATTLATGLALTLRCFLVVRRALDSASLASALARIFLNPAKSALACLACFLV
jgi:hypothetical protein